MSTGRAAPVGICGERFTAVRVSPHSPKGPWGQFAVGVARRIEREFGVPTRQAQELVPGTLRGVVNSGRLQAIEYNLDPATERSVLGALSDVYLELTQLERLTRAGARFWFVEYGTRRKRIVVRSLNPTTPDPFVKWWKNRMTRRNIRYAIDSARTEGARYVEDEGVFVSPTNLRDRALFEESIVHESVHAAHRTDWTKGIYFHVVGAGAAREMDDAAPGADEILPALKMPDAAPGYPLRMATGELEAQFVGKTLGDLSARPRAWRQLLPFTNQMRWLLQLRRELLDPRRPFTPTTAQTIVYKGVPIEIGFRVPSSVRTAAELRRFLVIVVSKRIVQVASLCLVRSTATKRALDENQPR